MKQSDKLKIEMSKARERLAVLSGKSDATDEERKEMTGLTASYAALEERYQAAVVAEAAEDRQAAAEDLDAEGRELGRLEARASLTGYVSAVAQDREPDGAEKELLEAREIPVRGGGQQHFPLSMLAPVEQRRQIEDRADAATNVTVNLGANPAAWLTRLFNGMASGAFVTRRSVPPGVVALPYLSAGAAGDHATKGTAVDAEEATISVTEQAPSRAVARYLFRVEDVARFGPMLEQQLVSDARMALTDRMEFSIFNGDAPAVGLSGELTRLLDDNTTADAGQSAATTAEKFLDLILKNLDGKYASDPADVSIIGPPQLAEYLEDNKLTITATYESEILRRRLKDLGVTCGLTGHVDAITGNQYPAYFVRRRGVAGRPAAVHSVWDAGMIIRDPYTGASKGEIAVTLTALHRFDVIDADAILARRVTLA